MSNMGHKTGWKRVVGWMLVLVGGWIGWTAIQQLRGPVEPSADAGVIGQAEDETGSEFTPSPPTPPPEVEARFIRLVGNMWWHQAPMRDTLDLSPRQIEEMDQLCLAFLGRRWARRQADLKEQGAFSAALEGLDLDRAERLLESRERRAAEQAGASDRLVLGVLRVLTAEQLGIAHQQLPSLFQQPWIKGVAGSRKGRALERARALRGRDSGPKPAPGDEGGI